MRRRVSEGIQVGDLMEQRHCGWRQCLGVMAFPKVTEAVRMEGH